jgi:DNA-directed RNA polymerase specialized sigma24 family protein
MTVAEIAAQLGLSTQRVHAILESAFAKCRRRLLAAGYEPEHLLDRHPQRRGTDPGQK